MNENDMEHRKIIHIDMDAFFAAVEQRDCVEYRGKPIIVGGNPNSRGVVSTCSYEARTFGIHSAMSCSRARQLCPKAIFVRPRMEVYKSISNQIHEVFYKYSDKIEPISIDEAFLDVTNNKNFQNSATILAQSILKDIHNKTNLTASAGVSYNKFLAKTASDINKPNGLTIITPKIAIDFIEALPVNKFFGVGKVTYKKMKKLEILVGADLKKFSKLELAENFGKAGLFFYDIVRGIDLRPVARIVKNKSISREKTLKDDIINFDEVVYILNELCKKVASIVLNKKKAGKTISLKIKYSDFTIITRSKSQASPFMDYKIMLKEIIKLLKKTEAGTRKIRLLGVTISSFEKEDVYPKQLLLPLKPGLTPKK